MIRGATIAVLAACGGSRAAPAISGRGEPVASAPILEGLDWLVGDWASEHWRAAGGALYGVDFAEHIMVMIIDDAPTGGSVDGELHYYDFVDGIPGSELDGLPTGAQSLKLTSHDEYPVTITMQREGDTLHMRNAITNGGIYEKVTQRSAAVSAPVLETADRARSALVHTPIASGIHDGNAQGFTIGTVLDPKTGRRSGYITIWATQPDGSWTWQFETGRPIE